MSGFNAFAEIVTRDDHQFPKCAPSGEGYNTFFRWKDNQFDRAVEVLFDQSDCSDYKKISIRKDLNWIELKQAEKFLDNNVLFELKQIEQKTNEIRAEFTAEDYLKNHPIAEYTFATNRMLSQKFGQMFSAMVFKAWIELDKRNRDFKNSVLKDIINLKKPIEKPFVAYADRIKIVVSFGLGWEEKYTRTTPDYIKNFLSDIKALGLEVLFLKNNPFGRVADNVQKITPSLEAELNSGRDLILISLCKGTPELLAAEAKLNQAGHKGRILGHVNLSGMLTGAIFSDFAKEIILPKILAPALKLVPFESVSDSVKMLDAVDYMKSSVIKDTVERSIPFLDKSIFYVNITGAPMSMDVFNGKSPMKIILNFNLKKTFVNSANDGFLEMPGTLIPKAISENQVSLILDSSHLLSDGSLDGHKIGSSATRQILYYSVIKSILEKNNLF